MKKDYLRYIVLESAKAQEVFFIFYCLSRMKITKMKQGKAVPLMLLLFLALNATLATGQQAAAEKQVYNVAIDKEYEPYEFLNHKNQADGFTPALLNEIGISANVVFKFSAMTWGEALNALELGKVDVVSMIYSPERAEQFEFSLPHSKTTQALFRAEKSTDIESLSSLTGHAIGFQENDISLVNLANREDFRKVLFNSKLDGLLNVNIGEKDAFFCGQQAGISILSKYNFKNVDIACGELFSQKFAFATQKGNHKLVELLNTHLARLQSSGKLQMLQDEWLSGKLHNPGWIEKNENILLTLGAILGGAMILLLLWNRSLHLLVRSRTKSLQASEERFRMLFEAAPDAIILADSITGKILEANHTACLLVARERKDIIGMHQYELHPHQLAEFSKETFEIHLNDIREHGITHPVETLILRSDGVEVPVEILAQMIQIEDKQTVLMGTFRNITARKAAENEIHKLNENLDQLVKTRTAELEAINKELETFSYSVSHDLKAPLRYINGFVALFNEKKSTELNEEESGYLKKIADAATEMGQLIDAILSFSKLNQTTLKKATIHTAEMVHQIISFFEPDLQDRKIIFNVGTLPNIKGDEELIRQVWTNLISNAIKYTGKKADAVIEIGSISGNHETTFFIKDNGSGFNMKYAAKLFGVFQRLHKSRDFEGVGIGLANVNRIVTRHGGHCHAEGEQEKGATFYFSLPK